jgi:transcriptional antiterminator RfaH
MIEDSVGETGVEAAWYVLRTQTKRESLAAASLREMGGIEVLSPRLRYRKVTRRGKVWWVEAMFPGYILARFSLEEQERAVSYAKGVTRILRFGGQAPEIRADFVEELKAQLNEVEGEDQVLSIRPAVAPGDEVELAEGPLKGTTGEVIEVLGADERVRIFIEFLGRGQEVEVDLFALLLPRRPVPSQDVKDS